MEKEIITQKEGICLLTLFVMGSSVILGIALRAKNNAWIAGIAGLIMSMPAILIYARILHLFPGMDLYEILDSVWGKVIGRIVSILYILYAFYLGAIVLRDFGEFVNSVAFIETPMAFILLSASFVAITAVRSGIEVIARISTAIVPVSIFVIVLMQILSLPISKFDNIKPILGEGLEPVFSAAFSAFSFPFAETVVFMGIYYTIEKNKSVTKVFLLGLLLGGAVVIVQSLFNTFVLGEAKDNFYFPSYVTASRIRIGDFLQRVEGTMAIAFLCTSIIKISACLFVTCKGIASIFRLHHYTFIAIQTGLLMTYASILLYDNIVEMTYFTSEIYAFFALPFQIIIPLLLWIFAEIKSKIGREADSGR